MDDANLGPSVYVRIRRPKGYGDAANDLVVEDSLRRHAPERYWQVKDPSAPSGPRGPGNGDADLCESRCARWRKRARHASIQTTERYTDLRLFDTKGSVGRLPLPMATVASVATVRPA